MSAVRRSVANVPGVAVAALLPALSTLAPADVMAQTPAEMWDRARSAARTGAWDEAVEAYEAAAEGSNDARVYRERARLLMTLARYEEAVEAVSSSEGGARSPALENVLGEALYRLGRTDEAEAAFRNALQVGGAEGNVARKNLAVLLWERGERERALELFDTFIDLYNRSSRGLSPDELMAVGTAVKYLGVTNPDLYKDALLAYDRAAEADPGDPRPALLVGELFLEKYNATDAHASFDEVLSVNPDHPRALLGKARALDFDGGQGKRAVARVREALEVAPTYPEARAFLAELLLATEDYDRARAEARRGLDVNPNHLESLSVLAAAHYLAGDLEAYEEVRARALEVNPRWPGLFTRMAELAVEQRQYQQAVELAARAVEMDSSAWRALGVLGMNELRTRRIEAGRRHLERAFEGDPYNPWFKNTLDLLDTFEAFETVRTEHFELFIRGSEAGVLAPYVAEVAEEAFAALRARYGTEPPTPIRVELFPSHSDFSVRTLGLVGLGALGVSFGNTLVMDSPSARPGEFNWASVLWHELAHSFHLAMSEHRVPRWFSEGLSVHEQHTARDRWGHKPSPSWLQAYAAERLPPVSRLNEGFVRPDYPEQVVHSYYQASLVFEMVEDRWGFEAVLAMLDGFREGRRTAELIRSTLDVDPEELDEAFDDWVRGRFRDRMAAVDPLNLTGGLPRSVDELRSLARRNPGSFRVRHALGVELYEAGDLDGAEEELRTAHELFPEYGAGDGPLRWLARIHEDRGDPVRAAELLARLGELDESNWEVHAEEARLRTETGDTAAAVRALEKAVEVVPFDGELHERLAEAYRATGDAEAEVRERAVLVAMDPADRAEALYRLAHAHHRAGHRAEARTYVLQALEIAPSYDEALELLLEIRGGGG